MTAHQQEAGAGIRDFISARSTPDQFLELMGPLRKVFDTQTQREVAGQREAMGATGNRMGSAMARAEGELRGGRANELDAMISQLFLQDQGALLQALMGQHQMGAQNMQPFFDFASMGVLPEETVVSDSPFMSIFKGLTNLASGWLQGGGGNPFGGGGAPSGPMTNPNPSGGRFTPPPTWEPPKWDPTWGSGGGN